MKMFVLRKMRQRESLGVNYCQMMYDADMIKKSLGEDKSPDMAMSY